MSNEFLQKIANATVHLGSSTFSGETATQYFVTPRLSIQGGKQISANKLFDLSDKILLIGPAGSGKTCLLKYLSIQWGQDFLNKDSEFCPLFISCSEAGHQDTEPSLDTARGAIERFTGERLLPGDVHALFATEKLIPIWDGIDEIQGTELQGRFFAGIRYLVTSFPKLRAIISTRPIAATGGLLGFTSIQLSGLNPEEVWTHVNSLAGHDSSVANRFINLVATNRWAAELSKSPLLLTMLWQIFQHQGKVPSSRVEIYDEITDFCLRTWNIRKGIAARSKFTLAEIDKALQKFAVALWLGKEAGFSRDVVRWTFRDSCSESDIADLIDAICATGIVVAVGLDRYQFAHRTFLDYYSAKAAASSAEYTNKALADPAGKEMVLFLAGLLDDATPVVEELIQQSEVFLIETNAPIQSLGTLANPRWSENTTAPSLPTIATCCGFPAVSETNNKCSWLTFAGEGTTQVTIPQIAPKKIKRKLANASALLGFDNQLRVAASLFFFTLKLVSSTLKYYEVIPFHILLQAFSWSSSHQRGGAPGHQQALATPT